MSVTRTEAQTIAEAFIAEGKAQVSGNRCRAVYALDELTFRRPMLYGIDLAGCWIAYVDRPVQAIASSEIVLVSKESGEIIYAGSAHDEG